MASGVSETENLHKQYSQGPTLETELLDPWTLPGPYRKGDSRECHPAGPSSGLVMAQA